MSFDDDSFGDNSARNAYLGNASQNLTDYYYFGCEIVIEWFCLFFSSGFELWLGQSQGTIAIFDPNLPENLQTINHYNPVNVAVNTYFLVSSPHDPVSLWSYTYPGKYNTTAILDVQQVTQLMVVVVVLVVVLSL